MSADNHNPHGQPGAEELDGALRQAVEQVKADPVPADAQERALAKAGRIGAAAGRKPSPARRRLLVAATIAAVVLPPLLGWMIETGEDGRLRPNSAVLSVFDSTFSNDDAYAKGVTFDGQVNADSYPQQQSFRDGTSNAISVYGRVAEANVPGPVNPTKIVGLTNDSSGPPVSIPSAPGIGTGAGGLISNQLGSRYGWKDDQVRLLNKLNALIRDQHTVRAWTDRKNALPPERVSGGIDTDKIADLYKDIWGHLPEKNLTGDLEKALNSLPPKQRKLAVDYLKSLSPDQRKLVDDYLKKLAASEKPDPKKLPQIWKQRRGRPVVARVYVGDGNALELVSLHVTTTVEGPRARTVVDHVFRNPHPKQLEGTFDYPLPAGASPSYFAMFQGANRGAVPPRFARKDNAPPLPPAALAQLAPAQLAQQVGKGDWGNAQEARVVGKQKALEAYEDTVRGRVDPALLEYAGGNTFSGRVFPIPAKGYTRILFAYEELLPIASGKAVYRFPLPDGKLGDLQFTLTASTAECRDASFACSQKPGFSEKPGFSTPGGGRVVHHKAWKDEAPGGDALFSFTPPDGRVQAISGRQGESGPIYLYARVRPELKTAEAKPFAGQAVFLLDISQSEHPGRFDKSMKLLRKILEGDPDIRHFNVLCFNAGAAWVEPKGWLPNTREGRQKVFDRLDGVVLEGATDLSAALDKLAKPAFDIPAGTPLNVFLLSDGHLTWGEGDVNRLVARFEARCPCPTRFYCYRTGLGAENAELFAALARKGGGTFNCFTDADLAAAAQAHRRQCLQVESVRFVGGPAVSDVLTAGRQAAVYPGGELVVVGRAAGTGRTTLVVEGTFQGRRWAQEYPVEVKAGGELAPRGWAEVAVASLLALNDPQLAPLVTAYCQQFGVASRVASFLILENPADYKRLNLEEERGRTVSGDLGDFLAKQWKDMGRPASAKEAYRRFLARIEPRVKLLSGANGEHVRKLLELLGEGDFELPEAAVAGAILHRKDVPPGYLQLRDADRCNVSTYLAEARRRADAGDISGAVRALSGVVEEHPARGDALRLVGYRLLDLKQPEHAARLFERVQESRPFEPHSYRDLARALEDSGRFGLAALQYEIVLAGTWHNRFRDSLKQVAEEEYARMLREAVRRGAVKGKLADLFGDRLERMRPQQLQSDLRVTISWNTDATDVDLWVIEPDGTKVFYQNPRSQSGGELSQDMTQGYGPERYQIAKARPGEYRILVHYYGVNPNLLAGETHVQVAVTRHAGTPREVTERHTVILKKHNEQVEVCRVRY